MANNLKGLDAPQVVRSVYDDIKNTIRVSVHDADTGGGAFEVIVNQADDSIRIGDGTNLVTTTTAGSKVALDVNTLNPVQIFTLPFDAITATYPSGTQEVYQSRVGGTSGTVQQTVTVNYVDSTKALILNVART